MSDTQKIAAMVNAAEDTLQAATAAVAEMRNVTATMPGMVRAEVQRAIAAAVSDAATVSADAVKSSIGTTAASVETAATAATAAAAHLEAVAMRAAWLPLVAVVVVGLAAWGFSAYQFGRADDAQRIAYRGQQIAGRSGVKPCPDFVAGKSCITVAAKDVKQLKDGRYILALD